MCIQVNQQVLATTSNNQVRERTKGKYQNKLQGKETYRRKGTQSVDLLISLEKPASASYSTTLISIVVHTFIKANCYLQEKITDIEIAALTAVSQCIKDCNLDSDLDWENSLIDISKRISLLEKIKKDRRRSADLVRPKVEQEQQQQKQTWKKRMNNPGQPQQGNNKFPRTSSSTVRPPCGPPAHFRPCRSTTSGFSTESACLCKRPSAVCRRS